MTNNKIQLQHPDSEKSAPRIDRETYDAYRETLLAVIPADEDGVPFKTLTERMEAHNPNLNQYGSVGWYTTTVKLHLEAIGEIERVDGKRTQHIRRTS